jgi:hypothetical protein
MLTCRTTISTHKKLIIGWCIAHVEDTIFGVGLITFEILQIEAKFIVTLQCEFTVLFINTFIEGLSGLEPNILVG